MSQAGGVVSVTDEKERLPQSSGHASIVTAPGKREMTRGKAPTSGNKPQLEGPPKPWERSPI